MDRTRDWLSAGVTQSPSESGKRRDAERRDHCSDDLVWGGRRNHGVVVLCGQALPCVDGERTRCRKSLGHPTRLTAVSLDTHIATEWTEGRRRLDVLLALIEVLAASLKQEVEKLNQLGTSDPLYEHTARRMVNPTLRRFTFDQHLRDECRMLVPLLEFCGRDLADSQGMQTSEQLAVLAEIKMAIQSVDRG